MIFKKSPTTRNLVISYKQAFGTEPGKEVLFDLMNKYHVLNAHGGDAFKEGQRSVVLEIMRFASIDLNQLDKMMKGEAY